jgi:hypothetical protein
MSDTVVLTLLPDGNLQLSGGTFKYKDAIKAVGGKWNKDTKAWTVPFDADLMFLPSTPAPAAAPAPAPLIRALPYGGYTVIPPKHKAREEWTAAEWQSHVLLNSRRGYIGRCCGHATAFYDYEQGPTHYRCEKHGITRSSYTGT